MATLHEARTTPRWIDALLRWRWPLLVLGLALGAVAYSSARQLEFDQSIENMFAPSDPLLPAYRKFKQIFGADEVVMAAYDDPQVLSQAGVDRLNKVSEKLRAVPGVRAVQSLADPPLSAAAIGDSMVSDALLDAFEGYLFGADERTAALVCLLGPESRSGIPRAQTIDAMRTVIAQQPQGVLAGEPVMLVDGFRYLEEDGQLLAYTSTTLLVVVMLLLFRSLRWTLAPIAVVQLTLLLTQAALVWSGFQLSMVSSMLSAIVTIIGVATVVHLIVGDRSGEAAGLTPRESLGRAGAALAFPIAGACLTDAVGFGSLLLASVGPIQDFGVMMTLGSLLVMVSVVLLIPAFGLVGRADRAPTPAPSEAVERRRLGRALQASVDIVGRRSTLLLLLTLILAGLAIAGCLRLQVETDFTKNFRADSPVVTSYEFVEDRLGGAGVWDIVLPAPEPLDWSYFSRVRRLQNRLRDEVRDADDGPGLTKVLSLSDVIDATLGPSGGRGLFAGTLLRTALRRMEAQMPELMATLYQPEASDGQAYYRIMLRSRERQTSESKKAIIEQVGRITREEFPEAEVTGYFVLLTYLIDSMTRDQWTTFAAASAGIGLMMLLAFRSFRLMLVALVPNALPVLVVTGAMGWLGLKINMGAAMIAAVSMGLSVDSSIHYLTAFRRLRRDGHSTRESLEQVQQTVGRAMVFATLALVAGFSALCLSQFIPTIYFGVLVSITMLGGLAGNLALLPLLLSLTDPKDRVALPTLPSR